MPRGGGDGIGQVLTIPSGGLWLEKRLTFSVRVARAVGAAGRLLDLATTGYTDMGPPIGQIWQGVLLGSKSLTKPPELLRDL